MTAGRFSLICIKALLLNFILLGTASAGFFGSDDKGKSGLDLAGGYDVNTVTTLSGTATSAPRHIEKEHVVVDIRSGNDSFTVCVGPRAYWESKGIPVNLNDELIVKGSKAQGQDGKTYIMAQKVTNRTTGTQVDLRNEKGVPVWSGRSMNAMGSGRTDGGMRNQGGGMMRGGGGGMMRR